jgi:hypothetical protein
MGVYFLQLFFTRKVEVVYGFKKVASLLFLLGVDEAEVIIRFGLLKRLSIKSVNYTKGVNHVVKTSPNQTDQNGAGLAGAMSAAP